VPDDEPLFEKPLDKLLPPSRRIRSYGERYDYSRDSRLSAKELLAIARLQKWSLRACLVYVGAVVCYIVAGLVASIAGDPRVVMPVLAVIVAVVAIPSAIAMTVLMIMLAVKLFRTSSFVLLLILHFGCGLGLISLAIVNTRATNTLRQNGVRVGFLGVRKADIKKLEERFR